MRSIPVSPLQAIPLGLLAAGSLFVYSFPGLTWLAGTAAVWGALELLWRPARERGAAIRAALLPLSLALTAVVVLGAAEIGRMADFGHFETFDPSGPGLGNLFGQISPFEALGIWPSGDFRLDPGDGAVPAIGYYAGVALALILLADGLVSALRRRDSAIPAALFAAVAIYAAARIGGTPYTAAKAVVMIAPPAMLVIVRPLLTLPRPGPEPSAGQRAAAARGSRVPRQRRRLLGAGARQRPRRADRLHVGTDRAAAADRRRGDGDPGAAEPPRGPARGALPRMGAARRTGLHRG